MMTEPHMALFVALTVVRKIQVPLDLIKWEYLNHFDFIFILSLPAIQRNVSMLSQYLVWSFLGMTGISQLPRCYGNLFAMATRVKP